MLTVAVSEQQAGAAARQPGMLPPLLLFLLLLLLLLLPGPVLAQSGSVGRQTLHVCVLSITGLPAASLYRRRWSDLVTIIPLYGLKGCRGDSAVKTSHFSMATFVCQTAVSPCQHFHFTPAALSSNIQKEDLCRNYIVNICRSPSLEGLLFVYHQPVCAGDSEVRGGGECEQDPGVGGRLPGPAAAGPDLAGGPVHRLEHHHRLLSADRPVQGESPSQNINLAETILYRYGALVSPSPPARPRTTAGLPV